MTKNDEKQKTIGEIGEFNLIDLLTGGIKTNEKISLGIGDDAASLKIPENHEAIVTSDLLVEDVHFRKTTTSAFDLGHKALAVNLSDIAAMGGVPVAAFVSIALPKDLELSWLREFYEGMNALAEKFNCPIAGGDTTGSPEKIVISITCVGSCEREKLLVRSKANVGDDIWICGNLGLSRAGLEILDQSLHRNFMESDLEVPINTEQIPEKYATNTNKQGRIKEHVLAHIKPTPRLLEGRHLALSNGCTSCIDVSDGLLGDLAHICQKSKVGAKLYLDQIPVSTLKSYLTDRNDMDLDPSFLPDCDQIERKIFHYICNGGEDYALLFTTKPDFDLLGDWPTEYEKPVKIGRITSQDFIVLIDKNGNENKVQSSSFDHFN